MNYCAGRIRQIFIRRLKAMFFKNRDRFVKAFYLQIRKIVFIQIVGRCKMSHQTFDLNMLEFRKLFHEFLNFVKTNPNSAHAGIDFDVDIGHNAGLKSRSIKAFGLFDLRSWRAI